jgi:uroporphyrinogen decarboxylase
MNSKQRVRAAIARQPVDKVPLGFYAADHDTVAAVLGRKTYVRNKIAIQVGYWEGRRDEVVEGLKKDTVEFYRKIDCADLILPKECPIVPPRGYRDDDPPRPIDENKWADSRGRVWQAVPHVNEILIVHDLTPRKDTWTAEDFEARPEVPPPDESIFEAVDYLIEHLGDDRYVCSVCPLTALTLIGGTENGLMMYALQPDVVHAANRQAVERQNQLDLWHIRPGSAGVYVDQDMAGTNGPLISPAMFRDMCLPYMKARIAHIKRTAGPARDQLTLHNCGNNVPLMEMFIEAGVDCYQSLQTTAGMEVGRLKGLFGDRLALWGGVAVEVLIGGTAEEVRREVRRAMERGAPGGGFILGPSHSVAKNTKYENFMAMLDEFTRLRDKF